jgi:molecular chaperone Hsp31 and glyoxalase 3
MLGIPEDPNVGKLLRQAHDNDLFTISLCHGPGSFLATALEGHEFLYSGYNMAAFPDSVDKMTPMIGYMPGHMPWRLEEKLTELGAKVVNKKADNTCCVDRHLITGASPLAANELGKLAVTTLLERLT